MQKISNQRYFPINEGDIENCTILGAMLSMKKLFYI
jgi:hypothetical protein